MALSFNVRYVRQNDAHIKSAIPKRLDGAIKGVEIIRETASRGTRADRTARRKPSPLKGLGGAGAVAFILPS
jgi:hypothetical protein